MSSRRQPGAVEGGGGGGHRADAHDLGADAGHGPRPQREQRPQPAPLGLGAGGDHAHRGAVVLPAGVARGHGGLRRRSSSRTGSQRRQVLECGRPARGCSSRSTTTSGFLAARHGHRHQLVGEPARVLGGARHRCWDRTRQLVLLLAGDAVLAAQVLRGLQHAAGHRVVAPPAVSRARTRRSISAMPPPRTPVRRPERVVLDAATSTPTPPATTTRAAPVATWPAAYSTACKPEPQRRSIWQAGHAGAETRVERGDPADRRGFAVGIATVRERRRPRRPPAVRCGSPARSARWRRGRWRPARPARRRTGPTGVRTGSQITTSVMASTLGPPGPYREILISPSSETLRVSMRGTSPSALLPSRSPRNGTSAVPPNVCTWRNRRSPSRSSSSRPSSG